MAERSQEKGCLLVTGAAGLLGSKLLPAARARFRVIATDSEELPAALREATVPVVMDIRDDAEVSRVFKEFSPDVVIHAAAYTNVDGCETNRELAYEVNVEGTRNVARATASCGAKIMFLSTDYVFDGMHGPYSEDASPNPIGYYGETKLEGERIVAEAVPSYGICRTNVLYGYAPHVRPNFVTWVVDSLRAYKAIRVVNDQYGTPTLADNLASMVLDLVSAPTGIYHTSGPELINRHQLACLTADVFGLNRGLISQTDTASLNQAAPRPMMGGLAMPKTVSAMTVQPVACLEGLGIVLSQMESRACQDGESPRDPGTEA